jgi:hypothetical protein
VLEETEGALREAVGLPELLAASFTAFESIRMTARAWEDQVPELVATFITVADAAVEGREAVTSAPSLARAPGCRPPGRVAAGAGVREVTGVLGALGMLLSRRLADGAATAAARDRGACLAAAAAARQISALMASDGHDGCPG